MNAYTVVPNNEPKPLKSAIAGDPSAPSRINESDARKIIKMNAVKIDLLEERGDSSWLTDHLKDGLPDQVRDGCLWYYYNELKGRHSQYLRPTFLQSSHELLKNIIKTRRY